VKVKHRRKSNSDIVKQKLVQVELPPRAFRHGKPLVMAADLDLRLPNGGFDPGEVGIRKSNTALVAAGPTRKRGLMNGGVNRGTEPAWWKEQS
jgi:hypothetical protein